MNRWAELVAQHQVAPISIEFYTYENIYIIYLNRCPDCVGLTSTYEIAMLQDESLKLLSESCGGATRMGHILLTLPYIRSAADRKVIQVIGLFLLLFNRFMSCIKFLKFLKLLCCFYS